MSTMGRPRKPTAVKELEGTYRKDRAAVREPKPKVTIPSCPSWLPNIAKREYRRMARILADMRVLTEADRMALAAYAHQYAKWREAEEQVKKEGTVLISEKGGMYINPRQNVANVALKNMRAIMSEFGMTPASRTRVSAAPEDEKDIATQLFESVVGHD